MWNKRIYTSMALIILLSFIGSLVEGSTVEISPLNSPADLDLSGDIVYAVNFGNNGNPQFGEVVFSQDQDYPDLTFTTTAEGETSTWEGLPPNTGDSNLDMLLHGVTWKNNSGSQGRTTFIDLGGLVVDMQYQLQLIFYTNHSRPMDIAVEGDIIIEQYDPFPAQGSVQGKGGSIVKHNFYAGDATMNISITPRPDNGSLASVISGLILTKKPGPELFADYGSGTTIELAVGKGIWQLNWGQGPWTWSDSTDLPLLDSNVSGILDIHATAPADVSADLVATLPIAGTLTLSAHDEDYKDVTTGTMVLSGTGINVIDINASHVLVDEGSGMAFAPFHAPDPKLTLTLDEATGVFAYVNQTGDWELHFAGSYAAPLVKGLELQGNILAALGGQVPVIGGIGTFALTGQYIPDMSKKVKSFCEYGTGINILFGNPAKWEQSWGQDPHEWFACEAPPEMDILGANCVSTLETHHSGPDDDYTINADLIYRRPNAGTLTITTVDQNDPDQITGSIICQAKGAFVADLNAANAVETDEGTIVIAFGGGLLGDPDLFITEIEATGKFTGIQAFGWKLHTSGTVTLVRVPSLTVQDNIFAALTDPELRLGAEEEIVLSGSYYIDPSEE